MLPLLFVFDLAILVICMGTLDYYWVKKFGMLQYPGVVAFSSFLISLGIVILFHYYVQKYWS